MIDIHTHILPKIDDGSESIEETSQILSNMKMQGVTRVFATPHFYADNEDPIEFLERRKESYDSIKDSLEDYDLVLGAEVHYFNGIGVCNEIEKLLLGENRYLLLEMPNKRFSQNIIDDLMNLRQSGIRPIIAHLNRYKEFKDDEFIFFCNMQGIPIQLNTECIIDRFQRKRAIQLIEEQRVQFLATDCHGIKHRRPNLKEAFDIVRQYTNDSIVDEFIENEVRIIDA